METTSAGIIVYVHLNGKIYAILRRCPLQNLEKLTDESIEIPKESWPGAIQVTAHGKLENGEKPLEAVWRELQEELGYEFTKLVIRSLKNSPVLTKENGAVTYGIMIDGTADHLYMIADRNVHLITEDEVDSIRNLREITTKEEGVTDLRTLAMFPDEIKAVREGFRLLSFSK